MSNQVISKTMGAKLAPPYANPFGRSLEETVLSSVELPKYFSHDFAN